MRVESARLDGRLQRTDVDVEFLGQLVQQQPLVLSPVVGDHFAGTLQHRAGDNSSPAIPWPEGFELVHR
jgi:hypothetical protein